MASSNSGDGSPQQKNPTENASRIQEITNKLTGLLQILEARKLPGAKKEESKDGKDEKDISIQLEKANKELRYMIGAFKKLVAFEVDISKSLKTLEMNVKDIQADLGRRKEDQELDESLKQLIERNLEVLRSNLTKVKILIPLQHQVSVAGSEERRYNLQTTVASKEVLPSPYEAKLIFESGSFVKEFQDHYKALDVRRKLCLLCFAIFPENAEVRTRLLRFWWLGERLTEEMNFVNETLREFVEKGFIEPVNKKRKLQPTSYKMHPIIRSLIIKLAMEANFFDYDSKGNPTMEISASKKSCLVKSEQGTPSWFSRNFFQSGIKQKPASSESKPRKNEVEQPKISDDQRINLEKQRQNDLDELQTLFNVSKQFPDLPVELFSKMRNIGVLYLGRWESTAERHIEVEDTKFLNGLKNMRKLRFFSLQGISGISKLPKSLSKLTNLRILDLRACNNLERLPKEIGSLKRLTRLDLSECYLLDNISKKLSHLSNLEVLKGFVISKNSSCTLQNLAELTNLKKLGINVNSDKFNIDDAGNVFSKLTKLQKLKIAWGAGGQGESKSENGNKVNNGTKSKRKHKDEKKGDGNPKRSDDHQKKASDELAKSRGIKALQKLCGSGGEGPSKLMAPENEVTTAAAKPGDNRDAKNQGSDAAIAGARTQFINLVKLDLECFPRRDPPEWLVPEKLTELKHLYIRGGILSNLGKTESLMPANDKWQTVETLHLKYLTDMKTNWKEIQTRFPELKHLEKVKCPQITFCPCDANGVWKSKQP